MKHSAVVPSFFVVGVKDFEVSSELNSFLNEFRVSGLALFNSPHDHPHHIWSDAEAALEAIYEFIKVIGPRISFLSADQEGGRVRRLRKPFIALPPAAAIGKAIENGLSDSVQKLYGLAAEQMKLAGIQVNFAPVCDLYYPKGSNVVGDRSYGENPETVLKAVKIFCDAFEKEGIHTILKHYPGHGPSEFDSHAQVASLFKSKKDLESTDTEIFKKAAGWTSGILTAHIGFEEFPQRIFSLDKEWVQEAKVKFSDKLAWFSDDLLSMKAVSGLHPWIKCFEAEYDYILTCGTLSESTTAIEETIRFSEKRDLPFDKVLKIEKHAEKSYSRFISSHKPLAFSAWRKKILELEDMAQEYLSEILGKAVS